jgi:hypothetical protein
VVVSQLPEPAFKAEARLSVVDSEKMFHSKAYGVSSSEGASEDDHRDRTWDIDLSLYPVPTEEEEKTLPKVAGSIPWVAYCLCFVEFAERASYYGAQTVFANFLTYPLPKGNLRIL